MSDLFKTYEVQVYANGIKGWFLNGKRHREDGPAVELANGTKHWYLNDELHREDGPACEYTDGSKFWYLKGKLHREDGPAYECADGSKSWYLNDKPLTEAEHKAATSDSCADKHVLIDGVEFKLVRV